MRTVSKFEYLGLRSRGLVKWSVRIWLRSDSAYHYASRATRDSGISTMDGKGNGEDEYLETGPDFQWGEERYWDTGDVWEKGDRFRVTCPRSKHYLRCGSIIWVSKARLWVVFDDFQPGSFMERAMVAHAPPDWSSSRRVLQAKRESQGYMGPNVLRFL
jgi:hypothetical protein